MALDEYALQFTPAGGRVRLGELNGFRERSVTDASTFTAIRLLDELLVAVPGAAVGPGTTAELTAADRDRLLAIVYRRAYGDRVESTVSCGRCGRKFDLNFDLRELTASLDEAQRARAGVEVLGDGTFRVPGGPRFRLPLGRDECAVAGLAPEEAERALLERCLVADDDGSAVDASRLDAAALQEALERVAPVLDLDLDARCPECGHHQPVHFNIQSYLLGALGNERRQLAAEVHRLAMAYGWSLNDILSLERAERRTLVALVEMELARTRRSVYA